MRALLVIQTAVPFVDFKINTSQSYPVQRARFLKTYGKVLYCNNAPPTLVVGIDNWHLFIAKAINKGTNSQPVAI